MAEMPESIVAPLWEPLKLRMEQALRRAYAEGYRAGAEQVTKRIMDAAKAATAEEAAPAVDLHSALKESKTATVREAHPNSAETRRFPYGAVAEAFRTALRSATVFGLTKMDLIARVGEVLQADVSGMDHRDTLKRLKKAEELRFQDGRYFAGPKLARHYENGAQATMSLSAPETAGAGTPSNHQPQTTNG